VLEARRESDGKVVAVKIAHTSDALGQARFAREAEAMAKIGPPHVPQLLETGLLESGRPFLVMERLYGQPLASLLEQLTAPLDLLRISRVAAALFDAVAAAHACGVLHRDLKPENIFLAGSDPEVATLIDFGLVRALQVDADAPSLTRTGVVIGTPEYMSPEQLSGDGDVDQKTDIYALGVILFELLTLRIPFAGDRAQIEQGHRFRRAPRPSQFANVPGPVEEVVLRCLAKERERRFADVASLKHAFTDALAAGNPLHSGATKAREPAVQMGKAAGAASERQRVVLLFLSTENLVATRAVLEAHRGYLAHVLGSQVVGVFSQSSGDHPGRLALAAARTLCDQAVCRSVVVDTTSLLVRTVAGRAPQFLSPLFQQPQRYASAADPIGVLLTAAARDALPEARSDPDPGGSGRFICHARKAPTMISTTTIEAAEGVPLIGRNDALEALISSARGATSNRQPALATVLAEPGFGKSYLAASLVRALAARMPAVEVVSLRAPEPVDGDSDRLLRELLIWALHLPAAAPGPGGLDLLTTRLGKPEVAAAVALTLGWVAVDDARVRGLRSAPGVLRSIAADAASEGIRQLALQRPLCLVVDDAQWADHVTLDALELSTLAGTDAPLWVCVLSRPQLEDYRRGWGARAGAYLVERLGPLDHDSAAELCRNLLRPAEYVPDSAVERLIERSRAVPLLLVELIAGLKRDGWVREQKGRGSWYLASEAIDQLPDLPMVEWLASREVNALPASEASYAQLVSLLAAQFSANEVEGVVCRMDSKAVGQDHSMDPRVALSKLVQSKMLVLHRDGSFSFRHALVRDGIAKALPELLRLTIHRAALGYYRDQAGIPESVRLPALAHHAACAGVRPEAADAFLKLADQARIKHAYLEADLLYTRLLEQLEEAQTAMRAHALRRRGDTRYRVGRYNDSLRDFSQARSLIDEHDDPIVLVDILLDEALAFDWTNEYGSERLLIERAQEIARQHPPSQHDHAGDGGRVAVRLQLMSGLNEWRLNKPVEAIEWCERAVVGAEQLRDDGYEILVGSLLILGCLYPSLNRYGDAESVFDRLMTLCREKHDERHLAATLGNRTYLWMGLGDRVRLEEDLTQLTVLARRVGSLPIEVHSRTNMALFLYWHNDLDAASPHVRRLIEVEEMHLGEANRPDGRLLEARLTWARQEEAATRRQVEAIVKHQQWARQEGKTDAVLQPTEQMLLEVLGLALRVDASPDDWETALDRAEQIEAGPELIEMLDIYARAAIARQDVATARRVWERACAVWDGRSRRASMRPIPPGLAERMRRNLEALAPAPGSAQAKTA
jgi:tetratricopeptide (TPR) repeat protein